MLATSISSEYVERTNTFVPVPATCQCQVPALIQPARGMFDLRVQDQESGQIPVEWRLQSSVASSIICSVLQHDFARLASNAKTGLTCSEVAGQVNMARRGGAGRRGAELS